MEIAFLLLCNLSVQKDHFSLRHLSRTLRKEVYVAYFFKKTVIHVSAKPGRKPNLPDAFN